ncbi:hypothetical protein Btru_038686 [Bulinus truncatus]|nr:hypothetical protein Btru_038686 [Bulinus truncatus]
MSAKSVKCCTIMASLLCCWETVEPHNGSDRIAYYSRLRQDILHRDPVVNQMSPDMASPYEPFNVTYFLLLVDVMDIDQVKQLMTICVFFQVKWTQDYLSWDPGQYGNITTIDIKTESLWTPKLVIILGYGGQLNIELSEWAAIDSTGSVQCQIETYITFRCAIDFRKYPFDAQRCKLGILAYTSRIISTKRINYFFDAENLDPHPYVTAGEWSLVNFTHAITVDANNQTYPLYYVTVQRKPTYYVITVISPLILTSAMTSLVFLIPTKTGEKISFFVTIYMSLTIYLNFISDVMPRNLSSAPYLVQLLVGVLIQGLLANLATILVVSRYEQEKDEKSSTDFVRHRSRIKIKSTRIDPIDNPALNQDGTERHPNASGFESILPDMTPSPFRLSSSQLDKIFFIIFSSLQGVLLCALFGATDWLSDAPPL